MNMFNGYNQPMFESDPARENALKKPSHVTPWPYSQNFYHNQENPPVSTPSGWHSKSPYPGVPGKCACPQCIPGYHKNGEPMPMTTSQERMLFGGAGGGGGGGGSDYPMEGYQRADGYHRGGALMPKGYPSCSYPEQTAQNYNTRVPVVKQHPNADFNLERNSEQYVRLFGAPPYGHKLPEQRPKFWDSVNGPFYPNQPYQYPPSTCRYPPYNNSYYYQGSSQPQSFQSQQQSHSGPQPYYGIVPNSMRPMDPRPQLPPHLAKQDHSASKISPLRLMRKKRLAEPAGQLSPPRLTESHSDTTPPLDVRRFLATWDDEDEESPPVPQMVVLDCQELNDQQAALLRLYEESTIRTVDETTADAPQSKTDNHVPEVEIMKEPVKSPPVNENPVISNQTPDNNTNNLISPQPASRADSHDATPIQPELPTSEYRKNKFLDYDGPVLPSVVPTRPLTPPVEVVTESLPPKKPRKRNKKPTIKFSIKKSHDLKISLQVMNDNNVAPEETEERSEPDPDSRDSMTLHLDDASELDLRTKRARKMKRKRILEEVYSVSSEDQYSDIAADGFQVEESVDSAKIKLTFKRRRGDQDVKRPRDGDLKKTKKSKRLKNLTGDDVKHDSFDAGDERAVADTTTDYNGHPPNEEPDFFPAAELIDAKDPLSCDEPLANVTGPSNEADSSLAEDEACSIKPVHNSNTSSPKITSSCHITSPRTSTDSIERELQAIWNGDDRGVIKDAPKPAAEDQVSSNEHVVDFYTESLPPAVEIQTVEGDSKLEHDKPLDLRGAFHSSQSSQDDANVVSSYLDEPATEGEKLVENEQDDIVKRVETEQTEPEAEKSQIDYLNFDQISVVENDLRLSTDSNQRNDESEKLTAVTLEEEQDLVVNEPKNITDGGTQDEIKSIDKNSPIPNLEVDKISEQLFSTEQLDQEKENASDNLLLNSQIGQENASDDLLLNPQLEEENASDDLLLNPQLEEKNASDDLLLNPQPGEENASDDLLLNPQPGEENASDDLLLNPQLEKENASDDLLLNPQLEKENASDDLLLNPQLEEENASDLLINTELGEENNSCEIFSEHDLVKERCPQMVSSEYIHILPIHQAQVGFFDESARNSTPAEEHNFENADTDPNSSIPEDSVNITKDFLENLVDDEIPNVSPKFAQEPSVKTTGNIPSIVFANDQQEPEENILDTNLKEINLEDDLLPIADERPTRNSPRTPERLQVTAQSPNVDSIAPNQERKGPRTPAGEPPTPNHYASSCFSSPQSQDSLSPKNCEPELIFTYRRGPRTPDDEPLSSDSNFNERQREIGPRTPDEIELKNVETVTEELILTASFRGPKTPQCEEREILITELETIPLVVEHDLPANDSEDRDSDYEIDVGEFARIFVRVQCLSPIKTPHRTTAPEELVIENFELVEESVEWVSDENANIVVSNQEINMEEQEIVSEPADRTLIVESVSETVEIKTCSNKNVTNDDYELEEGEIVDEYVLLEISDDDDEVIVCEPVIVGEIPLPLGAAPKESCFDLEKIREMRKIKEVPSAEVCESPTEVPEMSRNPSPPGTPRMQSPDNSCVDLKELCCDDDAEGQEIVNEPTEETIVVEPVYELEDDVVPNDAKFQDVMANCLANAEKFLDREDGEIAVDGNKSMSSRDVLLSASFEIPSDVEIGGGASSGEVSLDFSPCYTALGTESLPVDNWPYLEEEVPLSPNWLGQEEDVPMQENIPGRADLNIALSHPLLPKKIPPISTPAVKSSKTRRRTLEMNRNLAPRSKFSSERLCTDSDSDLVKEKFLAWQRRRVYMNPHWQPKVVLSRVTASAESSSESNTLKSDCEKAFRAVKPDRLKGNSVKLENTLLVKCYEPSSLLAKETKKPSSHSKSLHQSTVKSESHTSDDNDKKRKDSMSKNKPRKIVDNLKDNCERQTSHRKPELSGSSSNSRKDKKIMDSGKSKNDSRLRKSSETDYNSRQKFSASSKNVESKVINSKTHLDRPDCKVLEEDVSGKNKRSPSMKVLPSPVKRSHDRSPRKSVEGGSSKRHVSKSPSKRKNLAESISSSPKVPNDVPKKDISDKPWICEVCSFDNEDERNEHVTMHTFYCLLCHLAFISEENLVKHLNQSHQGIRQLHHCRICELSFETTHEYDSHLETREHTHLEVVEKNTINTLFALLTGEGCPSMGSCELRPKWLPSDPDAVHFYHKPTPLSLAIEYWNQKRKTDLPNP